MSSDVYGFSILKIFKRCTDSFIYEKVTIFFSNVFWDSTMIRAWQMLLYSNKLG